MASSLFGRMFEMAEYGDSEYRNDYVEPIVIAEDNGNNRPQKFTIDLNINIHVYNHDTKSTED